MNKQLLFKIGIHSFLLAIGFGSTLSIGVEANIIVEGGLFFYVLVLLVNIGLLTFLAIGLYFWLSYFNKIYLGCNGFVLWLYIGCMGISGYWAYRQVKNGHI